MHKNNIFWIGYSDLMTSLFFIMLVLFVVTVGYLKYIQNATEEQLKKIQELQTSVEQLPKEYFTYQPQYKRFKLNKQIHFDSDSFNIPKKDFSYLLNVGRKIEGLISDMYSNEKYKDLNIRYLIIIEGMASKDKYNRNFELSYQRALSLYKFWKKNNIDFNPEVCEIQIAGSGTDGLREYSGRDEKKNQQFLIQIVPKMGKINVNISKSN